jgi:hypothetical protein
VSVAVSVNHLALLVVLVIAALVHWALGWVAASYGPAVAAQRGLLMAVAGALWGSLGFARGVGAVQPLR